MPLSLSPRRIRRGPLALAMLALVGLIVPGAVLAAKPAAPVNIQLLNVSDWHANLDPASANGGAWNISARWKADRLAFNGPTLTLTAGDDFGASPPLSGFFDEVPAIQAERLMGLQVNTFGNHNFDRGIDHLQSMIDLATAPSTGTAGAHPGQPFSYVATNLSNLDANLTGVERIKYFTLGGVKVAVLGIVNEEAPTLVSPGNFGTIQVTDGVAATKVAAREALRAGAKAVIVITHKGVTNAADGSGELIDFVNALPGGLVDVVIGDHTNVQYSGTGALNGILFHENASFGNTYAKTFLSVRPGVGPGVVSKSVTFVTPGPAGSLSTDKTSCTGTGATATFCDQDIVDMLVPYRHDLAVALDGVIGTTTQPFDRGGNLERRREVPLGDLLADGLRAIYDVQIGYYTGGSIRTQFPACNYQPVNTALKRANWNSAHTTVVTCAGYGTGTPLDLVKGDVYSVLPFGNNILTRTVTGAQLWQVLENGVSLCPNPITSGSTCQGRFPQVSGIKFTFNTALPTGCSGSETAPITWSCTAGGRVTDVTWSNGTPIAPDSQTYTFATTDFTNNGGDSYTMLHDGQGTSRDRDANAFLAYLEMVGPALDPAAFPLDRITCVAPCTP
ncbi:MAG TPA: 5'-nucleotidase C-terminal domain-containing protein [Candidatus Limnocylindria bacterium]|nr:5'-nucleotidase C-terminal domain-containing protein [Candidatus Limnocylindria bacterium]